MERFRGVRATRPAGNAPGPVSLHSSNLEPLMSALGQKRTLGHLRLLSALLPKADIRVGLGYVWPSSGSFTTLAAISKSGSSHRRRSAIDLRQEAGAAISLIDGCH